MNYKKTILKVLVILTWVAIGTGITVLLVSAVKKEHLQKCSSLKIHFTDKKPFRMLDESEIISTLWPSPSQNHPTGKYISNIDLFSLEKQLKKNPWVLDADIYIDQQDVLHINVQQRSPVARIFSPEGNSFYIDDSLFLLPLKTNEVVELPVFTNFTVSGLNAADSMVMRRITGLSAEISKDPFWMAQIEQININSDQSFEMITQMGDHRISLGNASNWEAMLNKLRKLYLHFGKEHEWAKYQSIDLQYKDQVVCVRKGLSYAVADTLSRPDSSSMNVMIDTIKTKIKTDIKN
jgi:cell division protein FtsQ